jgi:hypothetical protein
LSIAVSIIVNNTVIIVNLPESDNDGPACQLKNVALVVVYAWDEAKRRFKAFERAGNELLLPNGLESNFPN